jgi:putative FmdB family regulatory protein
MPYYDFRCSDCAAAFELQLPVERRDDARCPSCGSAAVRRLMPAVRAIVREDRALPSCDAGDACCGGGCGCGRAC